MGNARTNLVGLKFRPAAAAVALVLLSGPAYPASLGDTDVPLQTGTRAEQPVTGTPLPRGSLSIIWTTTAGETLRAIVRGLYPASVALQDAYIEKMRAENPGLNQEAGEPLAGGLKITLPDMVVFANESPRFVKPEPARNAMAVRSTPALTETPPAAAASSSQAPTLADRPRRRGMNEKNAPASAATKPTTPQLREPLPVAKPSTTPSAQPKAPDTASRSAATVGGEFRLRLSGAEMDLSRSRGVTEATRAALRDKQLAFDADDQIAAFLALKNTVKELETRINEMQLVLNASTQLSAATAAASSNPAVAKANSLPAPEPVRPPVTTTSTPAQSAPASSPVPAIPDKKAESSPENARAEPPAVQPSSVSTPDPAPASPGTESAKTSSPIEPPRTESKASALSATPTVKSAEKPPLRPSRTVEPAWWENIWLWAAVGFLAIMGIVYMLIRPRTPRPGLLGSPSSSLPAGRTSGFSNWASKPPEEERDADADEVQAASLGTTAESYDRTVTGASTPGERTSRPLSAPRSSQLPQRIAGPDDDGMASLELDTRPGMHIDFPLIGDEGAEDKARRLRYMEERFPELADGTISVEDPDTIIDAARHHFEDGKLLLASELLTYAFEEHPGQLRYWLALFEIYRLERKVTEFNTLAVRFKNVHGGTDAWPKVQHIGREFDPLNPLYAAALGQLGVPEDQEFDPIAENWLNVPMDFTSDALMAELRRSLLDEHGVDPGELKRLSVATYS